MSAWLIARKNYNNIESTVYWNPSCYEAMPDWTHSAKRAIRFADELSAINIIRQLTMVHAIPVKEDSL